MVHPDRTIKCVEDVEADEDGQTMKGLERQMIVCSVIAVSCAVQRKHCTSAAEGFCLSTLHMAHLGFSLMVL